MKHSIVIICLITMLCLNGCRKPADSSDPPASAAETVTETAETESAGESETEEASETGVNEDIPQAADAFSMDDYTEPAYGEITDDAPLYQDEYITITADSFETDSTDTYLFLVIDNTSDQDLNIACTSSALNDFMINTGFSDDVAANSTLETALRFENTYINASGIRTITSASLSFAVFDLADYRLLTETGVLTVKTDADSSGAQVDIISGELLYSLDNFQIINKGIIEDDMGMSMIALLLVNQSDNNIILRADEDTMIVDGTQYITFFTANLPSGKNAISLLPVYDPEQELLAFEESVRLSFLIQDADTWETIETTEPVTILREQL